MKNLMYLVIYLLSRSPLFSITLDDSFHEISTKDYKKDQLRMSILSLGLGGRKLYFFTFKKNEGFSFFKIISLKDIQVIPSDKDIQDKTREYTIHLKAKEQEDIEIEKEFLLYKINQEENKKDTALSKINNYIAIISILVPLLASNVIQAYSKIDFRYKAILLIATGYTITNTVIYILEFLKVKSFTRSRFNDIKVSDEHKNKIAESYYAEWYSIKSESTLYVGFVTNVERYLKFVVAFTVCILILGNFNSSFKKKVDNSSNLKVTNKIFSINLSNKQVESEDLKKITDICQSIESGNVKEVIIIKNLLDNHTAKDQYDTIYNYLKMYNINGINFNVISEDDSKTEGLEIKVILIGERK